MPRRGLVAVGSRFAYPSCHGDPRVFPLAEPFECILALGGFDSIWAWLAAILYFTFFHSALVLCGMVGLARAIAGQRFRFPLIGPADPP